VLEAGSRLGAYDIDGVLGRGRSAVTYRGHARDTGRAVALKVPHPSCLGDPTFVGRFLREGELGARLDHRSIVRVLEAGEDRGLLFIAMELVAGTTLRFELAGREPLPLVRALNTALEIADALAHAHSRQVVHRNLKPGHVMLVHGGLVKVMDFGVARSYADPQLTSPDVFLGSPAYAPPEAADPRDLDRRSDLYSLGIVLFEMLQGRPPFESASPVEVMIMHREQPLPPLRGATEEIPGEVVDLVQRLCRKDPGQRPESAAEVVAALDRALELASLPANG
jgi:serine/threonine-protein kinase